VIYSQRNGVRISDIYFDRLKEECVPPSSLRGIEGGLNPPLAFMAVRKICTKVIRIFEYPPSPHTISHALGGCKNAQKSKYRYERRISRKLSGAKPPDRHIPRPHPVTPTIIPLASPSQRLTGSPTISRQKAKV